METRPGHFQTKKQGPSEKEILEYVLEKFDKVKETSKMKDLVQFQTMNKYMIMAHNQESLKVLGNVVANHKKGHFQNTVSKYEKFLLSALESAPTIKTHSNVLMHIFGYFSDMLDQQQKERFFEFLSMFKENKITIGHILAQISPIVYRYDNTYLATQTYFLLYSEPASGMLFDLLPKNETFCL